VADVTDMMTDGSASLSNYPGGREGLAGRGRGLCDVLELRRCSSRTVIVSISFSIYPYIPIRGEVSCCR
jgi:hypothetical protein